MVSVGLVGHSGNLADQSQMEGGLRRNAEQWKIMERRAGDPTGGKRYAILFSTGTAE